MEQYGGVKSCKSSEVLRLGFDFGLPGEYFKIRCFSIHIEYEKKSDLQQCKTLRQMFVDWRSGIHCHQNGRPEEDKQKFNLLIRRNRNIWKLNNYDYNFDIIWQKREKRRANNEWSDNKIRQGKHFAERVGLAEGNEGFETSEK